MKRIKLFESYTSSIYEKDLVDLMYQRVLEGHMYEDDFEDDYTETPLSSGEKAALSREYQIISRPQLAALYLKALGKTEGEDGAYLTMIDGISDFGEYDPNTRAFRITNAALADAIGLQSIATVYRTVNKFVNLIDGVGETEQEALYPKVVSAFEYFKTKNPVQISNMAAECIQAESSSTLNREKQEKSSVMAKQRMEDKKKKESRLGKATFDLIRSLKSASQAFKVPGKAQKYAIAKISSENAIEPSEVEKIYKEYLISTNALNADTFYQPERGM
jgi:hypothetical protein